MRKDDRVVELRQWQLDEWRETNDRLRALNAEMRHKLERLADWLDRLTEQSERQAADTRFSSLSEACVADARNYKATATYIRKTLAKSEDAS